MPFKPRDESSVGLMSVQSTYTAWLGFVASLIVCTRFLPVFLWGDPVPDQ